LSEDQVVDRLEAIVRGQLAKTNSKIKLAAGAPEMAD
jgi:hypothetical protein